MSADKFKIAKHFILSSPYGQLKDVVNDVVAIVDDSTALTPEAIVELRSKCNHEQSHFAKAKDGQTVIVSSFGTTDNRHYLEPNSKKVYEFDHEKQEFVGASADSESKLDDRTESYRAAIDAALQRYTDGFFEKGKVSHSVYGSNDGSINVVIASRNVNLPAFWSGGWSSIYSFNVSSTGEVNVKARIKVKVHYFEDGNVQLDSVLPKDFVVSISENAESTGRAVSAAIEKFECEFHKQVEEFYVNMNQNTFKAMRRFLPVSRKPMEWNSTAHKLAADLNK